MTAIFSDYFILIKFFYLPPHTIPTVSHTMTDANAPVFVPASASAEANASSDYAELLSKFNELKTRNLVLEEYAEKQADDAMCAICHRTAFPPVGLRTGGDQKCSHTFCKKCIREMLQLNKPLRERDGSRITSCPMCRAPIKNPTNATAYFEKKVLNDSTERLIRIQEPNGRECDNECGENFFSPHSYNIHLREKCPNAHAHCAWKGCTRVKLRKDLFDDSDVCLFHRAQNIQEYLDGAEERHTLACVDVELKEKELQNAKDAFEHTRKVVADLKATVEKIRIALASDATTTTITT